MIKRLSLIIAVSVVVYIVFFANIAAFITGYSGLRDFVQAIRNYFLNALEYYLGIQFPFSNYLTECITFLGVLLIVAIALYGLLSR